MTTQLLFAAHESLLRLNVFYSGYPVATAKEIVNLSRLYIQLYFGL